MHIYYRLLVPIIVADTGSSEYFFGIYVTV